MPDRWIRACRGLVPEPLRQSAFDPVVDDLAHAWASRRSGAASAAGRVSHGVQFRLAVLGAALECRRLAVRTGFVSLSIGERVMNSIRDVRLGARRLLAQPAFTLVTTATLALGIGANLTLFSFVDGLLLASVNAPEPDRLVRVLTADGGGTDSHPNYTDARDNVQSLDLAAFANASVEVGSDGASDMRIAELVTGNYFGALRLTPLAGRLIEPRDDTSELASPVVVLSEEYWRAGFGSDPAVVGQTLQLNGATFEIVGVAPRGFAGTFTSRPSDLWVPVTMQQYARPRNLSLDRRGWGWLHMIGRLSPGASIAQAETELARVADDLNQRFPSDDTGARYVVVPASGVSESDRAMLGPVLGIAFAFTVLLFLVTCANLTGVMQARLATRRREMAIRQSLGAGRARLVWEWTAECLLLAVLGGAAGLVVGQFTASALASIRIPPELLDIQFTASSSWRVPLYAAALSVLAGLLYGVVPAWRLSRQAPSGYLKDESATATSGARSVRMRRALVGVQVALSAVLLVSAALLISSVQNRQAADPGFDPDNLGVLTIDFRRQRVPEEAWPGLMTTALEVARADPGVIEAGTAWRAPLAMGRDSMGFDIPGYEIPDGRTYLSLDVTSVGSSYFAALGLPFVQGGTWDPRVATGPPPVVINETMARRYWSDGRAVGQPIEILGQAMASVVGVVRDSAYYDIGEAPLPYVYLPSEWNLQSPMVLHLRTAGDTQAVLARVQQRLTTADSRLASSGAMTFADMRRVPLFPARLLASTTVAFGLVAVLLAAVGLNGVVATSVAHRTREIGVRLALGARPDAVLRSVLKEALTLAMVGVVVGSMGGYFAAGAMRSFLFGVAEFDAPSYALVALLLVGLAVASAYLPARRAARIDPVTALRNG